MCYLDAASQCHILAIGTGRFGKNPIPRVDRICAYCNSLDITATEGEINFILACPLYQDARSSVSSTIDSKFPRLLNVVFLIVQYD